MKAITVKATTYSENEAVEVALERIGYFPCALCSAFSPEDDMHDTGDRGPGTICADCAEPGTDDYRADAMARAYERLVPVPEFPSLRK